MAYTTIDKPTDYFNTVLYVGNGTAIGSGGKTVTGVGFQPDFVWIKARSGTDAVDNHQLINAVRGATKSTRSNNSSAEVTSSETLTSFTSDGFTLGSNGQVNRNGNNCVAWNWKCETAVTGVTTGGSERSYSGRVNTTAGISIINYSGNSSAGLTIPHHLGVAPKMIIVKNLGDTGGWRVYHANTTDFRYYLQLDTTNAATILDSGVFDNVPTSSAFLVGSNNEVNDDNQQYIAYCFAEKKGYSKIGSFIGTGNENGGFIYTGFKPAWILYKRASDGTNNWGLIDNKRDTTNPCLRAIATNLNNAESPSSAGGSGDMLSNGWKIRASAGSRNASGVTYIYMAFAENPFVTSTGVPTTAR